MHDVRYYMLLIVIQFVCIIENIASGIEMIGSRVDSAWKQRGHTPSHLLITLF